MKCPDCHQDMERVDNKTLNCSSCKIIHSVLYVAGYWNGWKDRKKREQEDAADIIYCEFCKYPINPGDFACCQKCNLQQEDSADNSDKAWPEDMCPRCGSFECCCID